MGAEGSKMPVELVCEMCKTEAAPPTRESAGAVHVGAGRVLIFGGGCEGQDGAEQFNDTHLLDINTGKWKVVETQGTPPSPRTGHATVVVEHTDGRQTVFVIGGCNLTEGYMSDVHTLDVATWTWSAQNVGGNAPSPRDKHKAVVHGSRIYLWGGFGPATSKPASTTTTPAAPATTTTITTNGADESGDESEQEEEDDSISFTWFDDMYALNVEQMVWEKLATNGQGPSARAGHGMCTVGDKLLVFAGRDAQGRRSDTFSFEVATLTWREEGAAHPQPKARSFHSFCSMPDNLPGAFSFGGVGVNGGSLDEMFEVLDTRTMQWMQVQGTTGAWPSKRASAAVVVVGTKAVVYGGSASWEMINGKARTCNNTFLIDLTSVMNNLASVPTTTADVDDKLADNRPPKTQKLGP
mmetsp:Transcript_35219/g.66412  ORF Transcript_35219/g.66412 Transcript_35219/m.66412 type:complete len:410 (+) Transcript_35219:136-1365(+)